MVHYFDAFSYIASWGSRALHLRLPARLLDVPAAQHCCAGDGCRMRRSGDDVILVFEHDDDQAGGWVEADDFLTPCVPVRAELARGDTRCLYLGWLLGAQQGCLADDALEPPVPPGLGQLSEALEAFAAFMMIDADLIAVAATRSPPAPSAAAKAGRTAAWLARLPEAEKDAVLARLMGGSDAAGLGGELLQRMQRAQPPAQAVPAARPRTAAALLSAAERRRATRERQQSEAAARATARAHGARLDRIAGSEVWLWQEVEALVGSFQAKNYARAVTLLVDLRDLAARGDGDGGGGGSFADRLAALHAKHARKRTFIAQLGDAGLPAAQAAAS